MELLRQCPCPVWLVARHAPHQPSRILAAVRASADVEVEQALNSTILQAWSVYGANLLKSRMPDEEFTTLVEDSRQREADALHGLVKPFSERLEGAALESIYGEPEDVISRFVESHGIDVVVMGTVARTGIAGLVMSHTAERVLRRLRGSVREADRVANAGVVIEGNDVTTTPREPIGKMDVRAS